MLKQQLNNLTPEGFLSKMEHQDQNFILVDCRQPDEYKAGHFKGAINVDYFGNKFYEQLENFDPHKIYLVYCRSGRRSLRTCTLMQNSGFTQVYNLDGGLKNWEKLLGPAELVND